MQRIHRRPHGRADLGHSPSPLAVLSGQVGVMSEVQDHLAASGRRDDRFAGDEPRSGRWCSGDRRPVADGAVRPVVIVVVEERHESSPTILLGRVDLDVQPFVFHRPVEPLDLAVGAWRLALGSAVLDVHVGAHALPETGLVAGAVVGEHRTDLDAVEAEEDSGPLEELARCGGPLVLQALDVGDPAVVVDTGVQVRVAGPLVGLALRHQGLLRFAAVCPPAAAIGDLADLLHIDVDHVAGSLVLVTLDDDLVLAGRWVEGAETVDAATDKFPVDSGGRDLDVEQGQLAGDARRAELLPSSHLLDEVADVLAQQLRHVHRRGRAILEALFAVGSPPAIPDPKPLPADACLGCDVGDRSSGVDAFHQPSSAFRSERCVSMQRQPVPVLPSLSSGGFSFASRHESFCSALRTVTWLTSRISAISRRLAPSWWALRMSRSRSAWSSPIFFTMRRSSALVIGSAGTSSIVEDGALIVRPDQGGPWLGRCGAGPRPGRGPALMSGRVPRPSRNEERRVHHRAAVELPGASAETSARSPRRPYAPVVPGVTNWQRAVPEPTRGLSVSPSRTACGMAVGDSVGDLSDLRRLPSGAHGAVHDFHAIPFTVRAAAGQISERGRLRTQVVDLVAHGVVLVDDLTEPVAGPDRADVVVVTGGALVELGVVVDSVVTLAVDIRNAAAGADVLAIKRPWTNDASQVLPAPPVEQIVVGWQPIVHWIAHLAEVRFRHGRPPHDEGTGRCIRPRSTSTNRCHIQGGRSTAARPGCSCTPLGAPCRGERHSLGRPPRREPERRWTGTCTALSRHTSRTSSVLLDLLAASQAVQLGGGELAAGLVLATPDAVIGAVAESGGVEVGDGLVATGLSIALRDDPLGLFDGVCHVEIVNTNCSRNQQETGENFNTFTSSDNNVPRQPCQQPHRIQQLALGVALARAARSAAATTIGRRRLTPSGCRTRTSGTARSQPADGRYSEGSR